MVFPDYRDGRLYAEAVPVEKIAEQLQTPFYCYSAAALRQNYLAYTGHFKAENSLVCLTADPLLLLFRSRPASKLPGLHRAFQSRKFTGLLCRQSEFKPGHYPRAGKNGCRC